MNAPAIFTFVTTEVRVVAIDGAPWFIAVDVLRCLGMGLKHGSGRWLRGLDADEVGIRRISAGTPLGGNPNLTVISEPGLYKLVSRSRKPAAKSFDRWVRHVVLPTIQAPLARLGSSTKTKSTA